MKKLSSNKCLTLSTSIVSLFLCLMVFGHSCSPIRSVSYDYDRRVDLAELRTYNWLPIPDKVEDAEALMRKRIKRAVDSSLESRGLRITNEDPDFLIAMAYGQVEKASIRDWGYPYGSRSRDYFWPDYRVNISAYYYDEGTLVLDFLDGNSRKQIWRGIAKGFLGRNQTPEKLDKIVNEAVERMLSNFPAATSE